MDDPKTLSGKEPHFPGENIFGIFKMTGKDQGKLKARAHRPGFSVLSRRGTRVEGRTQGWERLGDKIGLFLAFNRNLPF